ncbi:ABC transporter ATP-binding protein [Marinitoga aeolica]|uniref:ATP-binding cassette domain-containing protein n=1 Tax=Marinitoga aeolica TaxID=2809031 RepID=A0ABY8PRR8_9BACT|nr:oligopeptide/dipeptide ABC transporter ATP-binding protein [Marinitoga aeolica]WGS65213.1 ATP-binding cassette domain-containing protein [Marinitoga aeolica]
MSQDKKILLQVDNLKKYFPVRAGVFKRVVAHVKAVDDVSFKVYEGETIGLVGESGCGKSTTGMTILRLLNPTAGRIVVDGLDTTPLFLPKTRANKYIHEIYVSRFNELKNKYKSEDEVIKNLSDEIDKKYAKIYFEKGYHGLHNEMLSNLNEKRKWFRRNMQIIFQDPYSSLNPRLRIRSIIAEGLFTHGLVKSGAEATEKIKDLLEKVGLSSEYIYRFPHEFSGGQRQRIGIARALALNPKLIVADEAVSALDVSIQSQVINLLEDLQKEFKLTYVFIAHDLAVVKHISDRVAVMYLGKIVELADKKTLFDNPLHPYTVSLMSAIPIPDPEYKKKRIILQGDVPSPINPPSGCRFHTRCPIAKDICSKKEPPLVDMGDGHMVACHFAGQFKG